MRFMVMIRATAQSEAGEMPGEDLLTEMGRFNEALVEAGVILAGEGLQPSAKGARVRFSGSQRTVVDGPFAETKELIAGFWLWRCASLDEAVAWAKRCPNPMEGESEIEIRPVFEVEDFGDAMSPELREQEARLRDRVASSDRRDR
ncbi:MAG: YciI family protein [Rhodocyclaceae bacterium]|nr:YciI family protein [Rhodocyclaceae bacterium]